MPVPSGDDVGVKLSRELQQEPVNQTQTAQQGLPVIGLRLGPQDAVQDIVHPANTDGPWEKGRDVYNE